MNKYKKILIDLLKKHVDTDKEMPPYAIVTEGHNHIGKTLHYFGMYPWKESFLAYYQDADKGGRHEEALCPDERTACAWFIRISNYDYHLAEYLPLFEDKNDPEFVEAMKKVKRISKKDVEPYEVYTDNLIKPSSETKFFIPI